MNRAVFFDRDGTLMEEVIYCNDPAKVRVYPGASNALRQLKTAGWRIFVITNQAGIGRGLITEQQYQAVHQEFLRQLGADLVDATYYCPDRPDVSSSRRKPEPGMVLEAAEEFTIRSVRVVFCRRQSHRYRVRPPCRHPHGAGSHRLRQRTELRG